MMIPLQLGRYQRARVWIDGFPDISYPATEVIECRIDTQGSLLTQVRRAALELFIPAGPRALYGLLGAEFTPYAGTQLVVQAAASDEEGPVLEGSLASGDRPCIGLPWDFPTGVLEGACQAAELPTLGPGVLRFACAAYGYVGSSRAFFRRLSASVVRLLAADAITMTERELTALLELPHA